MIICLLLNVKEVFDHVALKQLVEILIKLNICQLNQLSKKVLVKLNY